MFQNWKSDRKSLQAQGSDYSNGVQEVRGGAALKEHEKLEEVQRSKKWILMASWAIKKYSSLKSSCLYQKW